MSKKCEKNICYGVDEYYLNRYLIRELIINDLPICYKYSFDMASYYYFNHPKNLNVQLEYRNITKKTYNKLFSKYIEKLGLSRYTYDEIDNMLYKNKTHDATPFMKKYTEKLSNLLMELYNKKDFRVYSVKQIYDFMLRDKKYFRIKTIKFINSDRDDIIMDYIKI